MRAAIFAAEAGHSVTLYEKTDKLGGQLIHGDYYTFKWPVGKYKNWLIEQLPKAGVRVVMNTTPSPVDIKSEGYDAVIAATGAVSSLPASIEGIREADGSKKDGIYTILDCFGTASKMGENVVICGGSESAVETAMYLCQEGHKVTILTRQKEICHDGSKLHWITTSWVMRTPDGKAHEACEWEKYENLKYITEVSTKKVSGEKETGYTVTYEKKDGSTTELNADTVIICGGSHPLIDEAWEYSESAPEFYVIGDANGAGNIQRCTWDSYTAAMRL